jgi:hypothetical protein
VGPEAQRTWALTVKDNELKALIGHEQERTVDLIVIQPLEYLTLDGIPEEGLQIDYDLTVSTDRRFITETVEMLFREAIGEIARNTFLNETTAASTSLQTAKAADIDDETARRFLMRILSLSQQFLLTLWLIRDNSGNAGEGFVAVVERERGVMFFSQRPGTWNFTADCQLVPSTFSKVELDKAASYFKQLNDILPQIKWEFAAPRATGLVYESRIARTLYFIQAARGSSDIGVKIAYYCIGFESLFSTDTAGVSHRIAERTAVFVATTGTERRLAYRNVHALYGVRSKVVHGSTIKASNVAELFDLTKRGDEHLRQCVCRILAEPALLELFSTKKADAIDTYFVDLLFPEATLPTTGSAQT